MPKIMNGRLQDKHDIEANWLKATNFIPLAAETIVYDIDDTHDKPRFKIGDGIHTINELPFFESGSGESSSVGQTTAENGEIFNDYENNQAVSKYSSTKGTALITTSEDETIVTPNVAGQRGFNVLAADAATMTYTLDSIEGLEINDVISVMMTLDELDAGTITTINAENLQVTVSRTDTTLTSIPGEELYDGVNYLMVRNKPDIGTVDIGIAASTEGMGNHSIGKYSHAEGSQNITFLSAAHVEGAENKALGYYTHAEGRGTTAIGSNSHAEGRNTTSIGNASHAEGNTTVATGHQGSHAEGAKTQALSASAHAEGTSTIADGWSSHSEGGSTRAKGSTSHSEGLGTIAYGEANHTEGVRTIAGALNETDTALLAAHAEGLETKALGSASHSEGQNTKAQGSYSHTEGRDTVAAEAAAHAEGYGTRAEASYAHSEGNGTKASGQGAHAEGNGTTASGKSAHAEGTLTIASGTDSHAEGNGSKAQGSYSHAEGVGALSTHPGSHAEGKNTAAYGDGGHAEGVGTKAGMTEVLYVAEYQSYYDEELGVEVTEWIATKTVYTPTNTSGASIVDPGVTTTTGEAVYYYDNTTDGMTTPEFFYKGAAYVAAAHAEGNASNASGSASHAEGHNTKATGKYAHSEGRDTTASGEASHAEGYGCTAAGLRSHVGGSYSSTSVDGSYGFAHGAVAKVLHKNSTAIGEQVITSAENQTVLGRYNKKTTDTNNPSIFVVGNGTSNSARKNAFEVLKDGRAKIQTAPIDDMDVVNKKFITDMNLANKTYVDEAVAANAGGSGDLTKEQADELYASKGAEKVLQVQKKTTSGNHIQISDILPVEQNVSVVLSNENITDFKNIPIFISDNIVDYNITDYGTLDVGRTTDRWYKYTARDVAIYVLQNSYTSSFITGDKIQPDIATRVYITSLNNTFNIQNYDKAEVCGDVTTMAQYSGKIAAVDYTFSVYSLELEYDETTNLIDIYGYVYFPSTTDGGSVIAEFIRSYGVFTINALSIVCDTNSYLQYNYKVLYSNKNGSFTFTNNFMTNKLGIFIDKVDTNITCEYYPQLDSIFATKEEVADISGGSGLTITQREVVTLYHVAATAASTKWLHTVYSNGDEEYDLLNSFTSLDEGPTAQIQPNYPYPQIFYIIDNLDFTSYTNIIALGNGFVKSEYKLQNNFDADTEIFTFPIYGFNVQARSADEGSPPTVQLNAIMDIPSELNDLYRIESWAPVQINNMTIKLIKSNI